VQSFVRILIFGAVGAASTIGYAVLAECFAYLGMKPVLASILAYGICACWSYLGHKKFTFASDAPHYIAAPRFLIVNAIGLSVATAAPLICARIWGPSPHIAILATCILVPIISFVASQRFVFRTAP
jgi:putative flippase GtrA